MLWKICVFLLLKISQNQYRWINCNIGYLKSTQLTPVYSIISDKRGYNVLRFVLLTLCWRATSANIGKRYLIWHLGRDVLKWIFATDRIHEYLRENAWDFWEWRFCGPINLSVRSKRVVRNGTGIRRNTRSVQNMHLHVVPVCKYSARWQFLF